MPTDPPEVFRHAVYFNPDDLLLNMFDLPGRAGMDKTFRLLPWKLRLKVSVTARSGSLKRS